MTAAIIGGSVLLLTGTASFFLGLLFLTVSTGSSSRLITGIIFLAAGSALLFFGYRLFRKGILFSPEAVKKRILRAAAKRNGELTAAAVEAEAGVREAGIFAMASLTAERRAVKVEQNGADIYIFPEFQFDLKFKACPYCGNDYPVRGSVESCPSCGGDLKIKGKGDSAGDEKFSMDIE